MSATMHDLHALGLNPFAVQLLAESMLKSAYVQHCGTQPLTFAYAVRREDCAVRREDCAGWLGVRITIEAVSVDEQPQAEPDMLKVCEALGFDPTNHHNAAKCPYCRGQQPQAEAVPSDVTDAMALAFHRALTDGAIGQSEVEEIKTGLRAAIAAQKASAT